MNKALEAINKKLEDNNKLLISINEKVKKMEKELDEYENKYRDKKIKKCKEAIDRVYDNIQFIPPYIHL